MTDAPRTIGFRIGRLAWLAYAVVLASSMGASCSPRAGLPFMTSGPTSPIVLQPAASAAQVAAAINANTDRVQTYQASSASIALPESGGLALVSTNIAFERPSRFRLRGTVALAGPVIDLGSNEERFWIWASKNEPPALYTARHDQWASSPLRDTLPIEPAWLVDALGLTRVDPATVTSGPTPKGNGLIELQVQIPSPTGPRLRVLMIDEQTAEVREQHVYDASGSLAASVRADQFRYDPSVGVSLPERIRLQAPDAGLELTINTGPVVINAPVGDAGGLWRLPALQDVPVIDLAAPGAARNPAAWDLGGVTPGPAGSGSIVTPFATASVTAAPTDESLMGRTPTVAATPQTASSPSPVSPLSPGPTAQHLPSNPPVSSYSTPGFTPATTRALPNESPQAGFIGLPARGRSLSDTPR